MNEESPVMTREKPKRRRSLWWLWLLLMLVAFGGGVVLGLKLTTMPLPYDVLGRFFPSVVQSQSVAETPVSVAVTPAPAPTAAAEKTEEKETEPVPTETPTPAVFEKQETATFDSGKYIGVDAALKAALDRAKVAEGDAEVTGVHRTKDEDGTPVYEVGFTVDGIRYDYVINAISGEVESWIHSGFSFSDTQTFGGASGIDGIDVFADSAASDEKIDADDAKTIAYRDAGVRAPEVLRIRNSLVEEGGRSFYEIEFRTIAASYSYQIDAFTGEILKSDKT